jgi:hypothetical protein
MERVTDSNLQQISLRLTLTMQATSLSMLIARKVTVGSSAFPNFPSTIPQKQHVLGVLCASVVSNSSPACDLDFVNEIDCLPCRIVRIGQIRAW